MNNFCIISDSCCDLTPKMADELQVDVIPLNVHFGTDTYRNWLDGREITMDTFYARVRNGEMPTTSAVSVGDFESCMYKHLIAGSDILCLCFASALSTTYQSACIAASNLTEKFPGKRILVVDSLTASGGEGLLVYLCAMLRQRGESLENVYHYAKNIRQKICGWFTVSDILSLKRGGRIDSTTTVQGSMVSIKPIIHFDNAGKLELVEKVRGRHTSLSVLLDHMTDTIIDSEKQDVFITYSDCLEDAQFVANELSRRIKVNNIHIMPVGPVIATHCGSGLVMLYFIGNKK